MPPGPLGHEAIGLVVLAAVCAAVVALVGRRGSGDAAPSGRAATTIAPAQRAAAATRREPAPAPAWRGPLAVMLFACALAPLAAQRGAASGERLERPGSEWPREWQGRALRPLALDAVEARFAARFPGRIVRLTDERSVIVWREVAAPTRMLHPAADCYRGLGYRIDAIRLERDGDGALWRTFVARRGERRVRVAERIVDRHGASFADTSAWFWAAELGASTGPWQAITVATPLGSPV